MFEIGDIIRHIRSDTHYLIVEVKTRIYRNIERIEFIGMGMSDGVYVTIHYPLMSVNYEKIA